ncbi:hypothetical protein B0O99DRAFT_588984 [Bisporella sp. PMI_857]|nr:hypothetical protein B0O99DRAFT_588984 [Bisporella sp. PMI_857]
MSSQQWAPSSRPGVGAGSVKRARERAQVGLPSEISQAPPAQRPFNGYGLPGQPSPNPSSQIPRARPQMPVALADSRNGPGSVGVAISRPTPVPQWPLAGTIEDMQAPKDRQYQAPKPRGNPPPRPPRPSEVPVIFDPSRLQVNPSFRQEAQQSSKNQERDTMSTFVDNDDDYYEMRSPNSYTSRPSTISSVGTIPDFPIPMPPPIPPAARRSVNLGPPPSSRRGASSYYSQASFVSPIPEESPRSKQSHGSYASSAAIPSNWGSDSPGYSPGYEYDEKYYDEKDRAFGMYTTDVIEEGRESRESNLEDNEDRGLIRSASLGKRAKPSMITTRSSEQRRPDPIPQQRSKLERMGIVDGGAGAAFADGGLSVAKANNAWPMSLDSPLPPVTSPLVSGTGLIDKSTSSSENEVPKVATAVTTDDRSPAPSYNPPGEKAMLGAYAAASSLQPGGPTSIRTPNPGFSRLSAIRRPPRLDIDAVRDAEARGSLTSLPDLIRRATRLAAMMDRGKRPASRLALDDIPMERGGGEKDLEYEKRQSGLSGMLAAFPPPGLATPTRDLNTPVRPVSSWPVPSNQGPKSDDTPKPEKKGRRCCGLPTWAFLLLLMVLTIIVAAAVVIPLYFFVIKKDDTTTPALSQQQKCALDSATACQNGGSSVLSSGQCACICINGFTGTTCTNSSVTACTTTTLSPELSNVTLGDSIPRLISGAQTNFSIPLSSTTLLARFSAANLTCLSENALVTFGGISSRSDTVNMVAIPSPVAGIASLPTSFRAAKREDTINSANGILHDTATAPVPTTTKGSATSVPTALPTSNSASPTKSTASAEPTAAFAVTETVLDFAKVAVLYVLQELSLEDASDAQTSFQRFFNSNQLSTNQVARNFSLGGTSTVNLINFKIDIGSGLVGSINNTLVINRRRQVCLWDL